jgi:hypothetical protein
MELLKIVRRRSFVSEVVYTALNIVLAVALLVIIRSTESVWFAFGLIILSKWRVFAVRPRYWFVNAQANLVDFIVSVSVVIFLFTTSVASADDGQRFLIEAVITVLYMGWLLLLKPRSKRAYVVAQAGVALFLGVAALLTVSFSWPASAVVLLIWLIGYATGRHVLSNYDEPHVIFLSLAWGLAVAEIGYLAYHWTIAYSLPVLHILLFPQAALIVIGFGFLAHKAYDSYFHYEKIRFNDIILPLLLTASVILVLLVLFNGVSTASV